MLETELLPALLVLEDGTVFRGHSFGATGTTTGEIVFNTSMTGYQEILTDPSYCGQIVTMTYPEIGNYGWNAGDHESVRPLIAGFVVRNVSPIDSNWRSEGPLQGFLEQHGVVGISGIDTRSLVRRIRVAGAMRAGISTTVLEPDQLLKIVLDSPEMSGLDLASTASGVSESCQWVDGLSKWWDLSPSGNATPSRGKPHVVALDFGMKQNIARHLASGGFQVSIVPGTMSAAEILALEPQGVFLSNGPGDPAAATWAIETIRKLLGVVPIFGICLGHQLLALACGAKTFKLKFGHRGANQPVLNLANSRVEITSQNHGFAVSDDDLPGELEVTHRNLNDNTIAGLRHRTFPAFSVQYHPEASAGPHDSDYLFREFATLVADEMRSAAGA
jgi:carbamoyl-phosphate synthase small subunit